MRFLLILLICLVTHKAYCQEVPDYSKYDALSADSLYHYAISVRKSDPLHSIDLFKLAHERRNPLTIFSQKDYHTQLAASYLVARNLSSTSQELDLLEPLLEPNTLEQAEYFNSRASVSFYGDKYEEAITFFMQSNTIYLALNDKNGQSRILNNMGAISEVSGDYEGAKKYFLQSIEVKNELKDSLGLSRSYNNLGLVMARMGDYEGAIDEYLKSVAIKEKLGDIINLGTTYNNLAIEYRNLGQMQQALRYSEMSLAIEKRLGRVSHQVNAYDNLAGIQYELGNYRNGILYADSALSMIQKAGDYTYLKDIYETFYKLYEAQGNYKKALESYQNHVNIKDSLMNVERTSYIDDLKGKYESELKEHKIAELEQEQQLAVLQARVDRRQKIWLVVVALLVFMAAVLFYNRFRTKRRLSLELDKANQELSKLNQTKDHLFAIISHDLKSPLSAFHTITASLDSDWKYLEKEQIHTYIVSLKDTSAELYNMMDNLLRWALTQAGQMPFVPQHTDLDEIVNAIHKELRLALEAKELKLEVGVEEGFSLWADQDMLRIILRNLVSNAVKFSPKGKAITIKAMLKEHNQVIEIMDQGVGMTPEEQRLLFVDTSHAMKIKNSQEKGTGLGLMLCKELIEKHEGQIMVQSKKDQGSVFQLIIPANNAEGIKWAKEA